MMSEEDLEVGEILWLLGERRTTKSKYYYAPLDIARSRVIRAYYRSQLRIPEIGHPDVLLSNEEGTLLSRGYTRVVVGDYGAFIEFSPEQVQRQNLLPVCGPGGRGGVKYNWLVTTDASRTKVYEQLGTVRYADYRVGMYYVDPDEVRTGQD